MRKTLTDILRLCALAAITLPPGRGAVWLFQASDPIPRAGVADGTDARDLVRAACRAASRMDDVPYAAAVFLPGETAHAIHSASTDEPPLRIDIDASTLIPAAERPDDGASIAAAILGWAQRVAAAPLN
jgi:hypothetical protein